MIRVWYLLFAVLFLHGCTLTGEEFSSETVSQIRPKVTTKEQIRRTFGEPFRVGMESGFETWRYNYRALMTEQGGYVDRELFLIFNENGTVQKYSFQSNLPKGRKPALPGSAR